MRTRTLLLVPATALGLVGCLDDDASVRVASPDAAPIEPLTPTLAPAEPLPPQPLARGAQCDATGRTVNVELRFSSTRGHVGGAPRAVYKHWAGGGGSLATNLKDSTKNTCDAEDQKRHRAELTVPVNIKCTPPVQQPGMPVDPNKPCQAEVDFGAPTYTVPGGAGQMKATESKFTGTYHLGTRRQRITDGLGSAGTEVVEDYGDRTSSCFFHEGTTHTVAHWCLTRADKHTAVAALSPMDLERGSRSFVVGLGAAFIHAHDNPHQWNINIGGAWAGGGYGPVNVGVQWNIEKPAADESTAWLGYNYTVQCGTDGKPYLVDRNVAPASTGSTTVEYDWTPEQIAATRLCNEVLEKATKALVELADHPDLLGDATILRARVRARDIDCAEAGRLIAGLLRNKEARVKARARRADFAGNPEAAHVLAAIQALLDWLASPEGRYATDPGLADRWKAIDAAIANLDMIETLVGLQELYAGELPAFEAAVTALLEYLRGPGPHDPARIATMYKEVQDRLADLLKNRLCRTRALAALDWDQRKMLENVENKEPYAQLIKDRIAAARTALAVRTLTCAQVDTATQELQAALQRIFIHMRGEKMVKTVKTLNGPGCQASGRAAFGEACDALATRMRGIEFADKAALDAAYAELMATKRRLCEPPARQIPVEQRLPPVVVPPPPGTTVPPGFEDSDGSLEPVATTDATFDAETVETGETGETGEYDPDLDTSIDTIVTDDGDFAVMEAFDDATLDAMITADDLGAVDDADVTMLLMLGGDVTALDEDAPWFLDGYLAAMAASDWATEMLAAGAPELPLVGEVPGEVCDLHHEEASWPTDDPCTGCVTCTESSCTLMSGYDESLCEL